jgi:hypothetical protein
MRGQAEVESCATAIKASSTGLGPDVMSGNSSAPTARNRFIADKILHAFALEVSEDPTGNLKGCIQLLEREVLVLCEQFFWSVKARAE